MLRWEAHDLHPLQSKNNLCIVVLDQSEYVFYVDKYKKELNHLSSQKHKSFKFMNE